MLNNELDHLYNNTLNKILKGVATLVLIALITFALVSCKKTGDTTTEFIPKYKSGDIVKLNNILYVVKYNSVSNNKICFITILNCDKCESIAVNEKYLKPYEH